MTNEDFALWFIKKNKNERRKRCGMNEKNVRVFYIYW